MKKAIKTVYYCQHCKKHGLSKHAMIWHEQWCSSNPNNITPCFNCVHLGKDGESLKLENGEMVFKIIGGYYCNKLDKQLHSFKAMRHRLPEKHIDQFKNSQLMPLTCEFETSTSDI